MKLARRDSHTFLGRVRQLRSVPWLTPAFLAACLLLALAHSILWGAESAVSRYIVRVFSDNTALWCGQPLAKSASPYLRSFALGSWY